MEAEACFRLSIALGPRNAEAHHKLACLLQVQGRLIEAEDNCRQAIALQPNDAGAYGTLIFIRDLTDATTTASAQSERRHWAERFAAPPS